jgi:hypothetical protein
MNHEYRLTRNVYPRNTHVLDRQGYYIRAASEEAALDEMAERFPDDRRGFTVHFWKD